MRAYLPRYLRRAVPATSKLGQEPGYGQKRNQQLDCLLLTQIGLLVIM